MNVILIQLWAVILRVEAKVDRLTATVARLEKDMSKEFDDLMTEVEATRKTEDAIMLLVDQLVASRDNPAKFAALAAELRSKRAEVDAKVLANTPAAPVVPPVTP